MLVLQSFDSINDFLSLSSKEILDFSSEKFRKVGWFKFVDDVFSALIFEGNDLFLVYGEKKIPLHSTSKATIIPFGKASFEFNLFLDTELQLSFIYKFDKSILFEGFDTTSFIDREDFDWGLFLKNIVNDKVRQSGLIKTSVVLDS